MSLRNFIPRILRPVGLRVTRSLHPGRFQAMDDTLRLMRKGGFEFTTSLRSGRPLDQRLRLGDAVFVRRDSRLLEDRAWA